MKIRMFTTVCVAIGLASATHGTVVNLSASATGFGTTPAVTLDQGTASGIADGSEFSWASGVATSPRLSSATNLQPYMTWGTAQSIRSVRVWQDVNLNGYDRIVIDQLTGSNPAVEGDWTTVRDTGTGLSKVFVDLDLGTTISTTGLRVRAFQSSADITVGEVATFAPLSGTGVGTLTQRRLIPTSTAASSTGFGRVSGNAQDGWLAAGPTAWTSWLSDTPAANAGSDFTYDMFFTGAEIDSAALTWYPQAGFAAVPSSWEILVDKGSGLQSLGTFSASGSRLQYYFDFGFQQGVQQLRLRAAEASVPGGLGVAIAEFEAFQFIPEPSAMCLVGIGGLVLWKRMRRG
jgi:hypothetical protein